MLQIPGSERMPYVVWEMPQHGGERQQDHLSYDEMLYARANGIAQVMPHRYNAATATIAGNLSRRYPELTSLPDDAYIDAADQTSGPFLEVGGPTSRHDRPLVSNQELHRAVGRPVLVSNLASRPGVELRADAGRLPFRDETLGLVIASCLTQEARINFFKEAERVLEPGGVLAYQRGRDLDVAHVLALGLTMTAYSREPRHDLGEKFFTIHDRKWTFVATKSS